MLFVISGDVERPLRIDWNTLLQYPSIEMKSDFHCVDGWSVIGNRWVGVPFQHIIRIVKPQVHAQYVSFMCADGYSTYLSIEGLNIEGVLLAYQLNGKLLDSKLGGPLRLILPHKYAYKSAMWITKIQFMAKHKPGYWESRGYSQTADVWANDRYASTPKHII